MDKAELGIHSYLAFVDGKNVCINWIILSKSISRADILHQKKICLFWCKGMLELPMDREMQLLAVLDSRYLRMSTDM